MKFNHWSNPESRHPAYRWWTCSVGRDPRGYFWWAKLGPISFVLLDNFGGYFSIEAHVLNRFSWNLMFDRKLA